MAYISMRRRLDEAKRKVVAQCTRTLPMRNSGSASRLSHSSVIRVSGHVWLFRNSFESWKDDEDTAQDRVAGSGPEESFAEPRAGLQRSIQLGSAGPQARRLSRRRNLSSMILGV